MPEVAPGTIVVFADIACPWATVTMHRLHETRLRLGLENEVRFDLRSFPLELVNEQGTPKRILDAEVPVTGALAPDLGWRMWQRSDSDYPVTMLVALEAVQAAKEQDLEVSAALDLALRKALFVESRNISLFHEVIAVAQSVKDLDADALAEALTAGRHRRAIFDQRDEARRIGVQGSPHLYLPDGSDVHNPGIVKHWEGEPGEGFPVVEEDRPEVYEEILERTTRGDRDG